MQTLYRLWLAFLPLQLLLIIATVGMTVGVMAALTVLLLRGGVSTIASAESSSQHERMLQARLNRDRIAPVFTPEVQFWSPWIIKWARQYGVDPDILATVIQIESCGHYLVSSPAGAQGLFQVMPFHFAEGENMLDPETNARRGIAYLIGSLQRADGHIGLAMAGYNGGWGVIPRGWGRWATETRNYYRWGSLIYMDALAGKKPEESEALQSWLNAGGINLCRRAAEVLAPLQTPTTP
ncbi:MAG: transglycosylase SLT domain-containing protein [Anaerolineae bacterium]|nr:transglycosylase SLT domain-containing protein [Anaerolineae bacterium]MDW8297786.1 transglycosylase SLT domain-containing protein [Anaerolineae bacterium]